MDWIGDNATVAQQNILPSPRRASAIVPSQYQSKTIPTTPKHTILPDTMQNDRLAPSYFLCRLSIRKV